jgi:hypothetical protein
MPDEALLEARLYETLFEWLQERSTPRRGAPLILLHGKGGGYPVGSAAECDVLCEQRTYRCKASLEERELVLKGELRLVVLFAEIGSIESDDERLVLHHQSGPALTLILGKEARRWAAKIAHPPSLIDKLGVKEGQVVSVLEVYDPRFLDELRDRTSKIAFGSATKDSDWIFVAVESEGDLSRLRTLKRTLKKTGSIWAIWKKGRKELTETHIREAAKGAGLVDVKVTRVSDALSGLKLMIPKGKR